MQFKAAPQTSGGNGSGNFLKLKDGESVQVVFRGNPYEFYVQWENGKATQCNAGARDAKFRFRINAVVSENGVMVAKIFEQGAVVYNDLKELHAEYGLETTKIKIKRNGSGTDTTYQILPLKGDLTKEQVEKLQAVKLHDLAPKAPQPEPSPLPPFDSDDEIPF
jgi:hypothetical protein